METNVFARVNEIQARYGAQLMSLPHVVGIGVGMATVHGQPSSEPALVVMVDSKVPDSELMPEQRIPHNLDGVRVDVQEVGTLQAGNFSAG
jgi:hypothetical protein